MAIRRDSLTMKLAAALLAFVAVFLGVRALDGGSASLTGQPRWRSGRVSSPAPPPLSGSRAYRPRCARRRPIPTPTPSSGSPTSSRCARRAIRPSIRGPRAPSSRPCGSIPELHRHQRPRFARPGPSRLPRRARARRAGRPDQPGRGPQLRGHRRRPGRARPLRGGGAHAPALRRRQAGALARTPGSPTSVSSTAICPVRSRRCAWRSPPAAAPPRTSATCRRWSGSSTSTAATTPARRAPTGRRSRRTRGSPRRRRAWPGSRLRAWRLRRPRSGGSGRWSRGCRCPST